MLNHEKLTLQQSTEVPGALGTSLTWATVDNVWGQVFPLDIMASARYMQIMESKITHKVILTGKITVTVRNYRLVRTDGTVLLIVTPANYVNPAFTSFHVEEVPYANQ